MQWQRWDSSVPRFLFATDLSSTNAASESLVALMLAPGGAVVDVVHVLGRPRAAGRVWPALDRCLRGLDAAVVRRRVVQGALPASVIGELSASGGYDLVIAPATPWLRRWHRGPSVREAVLTHSTPLLTGSAASLPRPIRRVGCHVSLLPGADAHLTAAADVAARMGAELHLLHVLPPIDDALLAEVMTGRLLTASAAREAMAGLDPAALERVTAVGVASHGDSLRSLVRRHEIDLLVVPSADARNGLGPSGLRRLPCPVLCVPTAS